MGSLIIGIGSSAVDNNSIKLSTKKGNDILNEQRKERPPEALKEAEKIWKAKFPNLRTRSLSNTYNCVGLVFGARRTCIDPDEISKILKDDEYRLLSHEKDVEVGDLVIYQKNKESTHIGIVFKKDPDCTKGTFEITVLSQWGGDGEYLHLVNEVPEHYGDFKFWTERKLLT